MNLVADQAAVGLKLRLAGAARADRAFHPLQVLPLPGQAGQQVFVLGERDLDHTPSHCVRARWAKMSRISAVRSITLIPSRCFKRALLSRGQFVVEDRHRGAQLVA